MITKGFLLYGKFPVRIPAMMHNRYLCSRLRQFAQCSYTLYYSFLIDPLSGPPNSLIFIKFLIFGMQLTQLQLMEVILGIFVDCFMASW